jgi:hypothetical protein
MGLVSLCIEFPNLDTMAFYLVFVLTIPYLLFASGDYESLKYYLPWLVLISVTLTESGKPHLFKSLYEDPPSSIASFFSRNIINAIALTGIMIYSLQLGIKTGNLQLALVSALLPFIIIFPVAQTILPLFIAEGSQFMEGLHINGSKIHYPGNWHKYFLGFLLSIFMVLTEFLIMTLIFPKLATTSAKNSVLNNLV